MFTDILKRQEIINKVIANKPTPQCNLITLQATLLNNGQERRYYSAIVIISTFLFPKLMERQRRNRQSKQE